MREWLCKIICGSTNTAHAVERAFEDDREQTIANIRRRIATIKRDQGWDQKPIKITQTQTKSVVVETARPEKRDLESTPEKQQKNRELDDLKAKLMGKKK